MIFFNRWRWNNSKKLTETFFCLFLYEIWCSEERPSTRSKPKAPERPAESIPDESINVEGKSINLEQSNVDKGQKSKESVEKDVPVEGSTETQRHSPDNDNDKVNEESVPKKEPKPRQSSSKSVAPERFDRAPSSAFIR